METYFRRAIRNVTRHGDTDIFPFPVETHVFHDCESETLVCLKEIQAQFSEQLVKYPPANEGALVPVSYTGFRWATQIDPLWNVYFLAIVLSISDEIEKQRIPMAEKKVFSYRCCWDEDSATIFDVSANWRAFIEHSMEKASNYEYVVICDISEFYARIGHHRLENALAHLNLRSDIPSRIMDFLKNFSGTNSFGLPVGGPAARILSELTLNQVDQLLRLDGVDFCRFSDDFHIFANSMEDAYAKLLSVTEKLQKTQGLQLQKSKTRVMSSAEFLATSPLRRDDHDAPTGATVLEPSVDRARSLLQFSLKFDPYSPTAEDDYENLRVELEKFDIVGLLQSELSKSRIHLALARKIVSAIRYISPQARDQAIVSMFENVDLLYPIFGSILMVVRGIFDELSPEAQEVVTSRILELVRTDSHVLRIELNLAYAIRVLATRPSAGVQETLVKLYGNPRYTPLVRRDIILAMTRLGAWHWLSERRGAFRSMSAAERRAFIIASYSLKDEGNHWRKHLADEFSPLEKLVRGWAANKVNQPNWVVPL